MRLFEILLMLTFHSSEITEEQKSNFAGMLKAYKNNTSKKVTVQLSVVSIKRYLDLPVS